MFRCPGQDQRFWKPEDIFEIKCPGCGESVEFFKDEPSRKCSSCKQLVANPKIDLGCAEWCKHAEQCLAASVATYSDVLQDKLIRDMKVVFGDDQKRIDHALAVLDYARQMQPSLGGDPLVIKAAAILHDVGIVEAERKYNSSAGNYQEIEGPPIAKEILQKYDLEEEIIEHICKIIANHHSAKEIDTLEFKIVWDADWLVNIAIDFADKNQKELSELVNKVFKTEEGRRIAVEKFLK